MIQYIVRFLGVTTMGQAAVLTNSDWAKLEKNASEKYRLILALLRYTGARINEVLNLDVSDCYTIGPTPKEVIYYRRENRKGKIEALTIPVIDALLPYLTSYKPPSTGYLFPSPRDASRHLTYSSVYEYLERLVIKANLKHKHVKTHSGRRTLITNLSRQGTDFKTIAAISGHKSIQNLVRYVDTDPSRCKRALENAYS